MRTRGLHLARYLLLLLVAGLGYAAFCSFTGLAVPCPFHLLTGLLCPGCGVTRMCLALLRLDFSAAWSYNPGLLLLSPVLLALLATLAGRYLRTGERRPTRTQSIALWGIVGYLLVYGVLRNLL